MNLSLIVLLIIGIIAANAPFFTDRLLFIWQLKGGNKTIGWRLLELILLYFLVGIFAYFLERRTGQAHIQSWEFYAVTGSLFLVFAYPGYVVRYLWRKR